MADAHVQAQRGEGAPACEGATRSPPISPALTRLPPSGSVIGLRACATAWRVAEPGRVLRDGLSRRLGGVPVTLHASGREALRVALERLARRPGRDEVVVPAYTCFSIPAAAVAAGLRVRLVDVDARGAIRAESLAALPLERAAAVVVSNLFGVPEPLVPLREALGDAGAALVDDAAQSLGAGSPEGPAGARGDVGVLSFGRGKPLSALGGGALVWTRLPDPGEAELEAPARRLAAVARAAVWDAALRPAVFRWLAAVPALGIGETRFDPGFRRGPIDGASVRLAAALLPGLDDNRLRRAARAEALAARLAAETRFAPLLPSEGATGAYPRLGVLAPDASARERAVAELGPLGASAMYPSALDAVAPLRPHLVGETACPGARDFASRVLTLPTHAALLSGPADQIVRRLGRVA